MTLQRMPLSELHSVDTKEQNDTDQNDLQGYDN